MPCPSLQSARMTCSVDVTSVVSTSRQPSHVCSSHHLRARHNPLTEAHTILRKKCPHKCNCGRYRSGVFSNNVAQGDFVGFEEVELMASMMRRGEKCRVVVLFDGVRLCEGGGVVCSYS